MRLPLLIVAFVMIASPAVAQSTAPGQGLWQARVSVEYPMWTAAVRSGKSSQFFSGYGAELATELGVRPNQAIGASLVVMRGLTPDILSCDVGDTRGSDRCGDPLGQSNGIFATFRQYLPGSGPRGYLSAVIGAGAYDFDGYYLGRHVVGTGPALMYGAEAETPSLWDLSLMASLRAQLIFESGTSPLHAATASVGIRVR